MTIIVKYGTRPGEKFIESGNFICPFCSRKRQYKRYKIVREVFLGVVSFPTKGIGEFVHCQGCLQVFPSNVLDAGSQLKVNIDESVLPPANIIDLWQDAYTSLNCEGLLAGNKDIVEVINLIVITLAKQMQMAGLKIRLQEFQEARKCLTVVLNTCIDWEEINIRDFHRPQTRMPKLHNQIIEYMKFSHQLLSRLL